MAKEVKSRVKKSKVPVCDICHQECGSLHTVFTAAPEYKEVKGIKQCIYCLGLKK